MNTNPWYVDVEFNVAEQVTEDAMFDVLDALHSHSAAASFARDRRSAGISLTVEAEGATTAANEAAAIVRSLSNLIGEAEIVKIDVETEEQRRKSLEKPTIPELVGFAEIAELASVSRQRARQLADRPDFPVAVVETAAGPLRVKAAVEGWLRSWNRAPGRPRKVATA